MAVDLCITHIWAHVDLDDLDLVDFKMGCQARSSCFSCLDAYVQEGPRCSLANQALLRGGATL